MKFKQLRNPDTSGAAGRYARALHYGDGVFRSALIWAGAVADVVGQLRHLLRDAERLFLEAPAMDALETQIAAAVSGIGQGVLRIQLVRAASARGYASDSDVAELLVEIHPLPQYPSAYWQRGVHVGRTDFRLASQPRLAGIKHLNRLEQVLAARAIPSDCQEGLVENADGAPVSGTRSNLFWVRQGEIFTAPLQSCGVSGRMRARIIECAKAQGWSWSERSESWADLATADELFLSNSLIGVWPVRQLQDIRMAAPGPVTQQLMRHLDHPWQGQKTCA